MSRCYSAWNRPKTIPAPSGDGLRQNYTVMTSPSGEKILKPAEIIDEYEQIQSHADECELQKIIMQCGMPHDDMGFFTDPKEYGCLATGPMTLQESLNKIAEAKSKWEVLPEDIKTKFNHSFDEWLKEVGEPAWLEKMGIEVIENEPGTRDAIQQPAADQDEKKPV